MPFFPSKPMQLFTELALGGFSLVVAMSVCLSVRFLILMDIKIALVAQKLNSNFECILHTYLFYVLLLPSVDNHTQTF